LALIDDFLLKATPCVLTYIGGYPLVHAAISPFEKKNVFFLRSEL